MEDPLPSNPYNTLNVPKDATLATIRSSYRKLVLSCHPDKVKEEAAKKIKAEQFHQVQQAWEILGDDKRRQRYDEKVKLEELKAEMANERGPSLSRRNTDFEYGPSRGVPRREYREDIILETREPRNNRYSDEEYPQSRRENRRPYDDYFPPTRRSSGRPSVEKRRTRDVEDEREVRRRERDERARIHEDKQKKTAKERKWSSDAKAKSRGRAHYDSESDSEYDSRRYSSKHETPARPGYGEIPFRSRENVRKNGKSERGYDDQDDVLYSKLSGAADYMNKVREPEIDPHPPTRNRTASNLEPRTPPAPPVDSAKRSSARRGYVSRQPSPVRSSKNDKHSPDSFDTPSSRKPSLPGATSDPRGIKKSFFGPARKEPQRSATYQHVPEYKQPSIRRSETAPLNSLRGKESVRPSPLKKGKAASDSETSYSDSDSTEDHAPPVRANGRPNMPKTTSYRYTVDPEGYPREPKASSPPKAREDPSNIRRSANRPTMVPRGSTTQPPPMPRAGSGSHADERSPRPGMLRTESARPTPTKSHQPSRSRPLYGETNTILEEDHPSRRSLDTYPEEKGRYNSYSRRGSEDVDPDAYPGSSFRHHRPHLGRHGTAVN